MTNLEMNSLKNTVAFASGISADKVDVMGKAFVSSAQAANAQPAGILPFDWRILAAAGGGFLLIVILTVLFLAKRRKKRAKELEAKLLQEEGANPNEVAEEIPSESIEEIRQPGEKKKKYGKICRNFLGKTRRLRLS